MCNIAGYIGTKDAAQVLLDMMKREEGFAGGYYTGLATLDGGRIHYAKLTGDTDKLIAETDAKNLPGKMGIIHSRSKSGGGDEWAHPFVGLYNGEPELAYVANGYNGFFETNLEKNNALSEQMLQEGYQMLSRIPENKNKAYPTLSDGSAVHMSDTMCQLIYKNVLSGIKIDRAMEKAFCTMPGEIVGLSVSITQPYAIGWSRINMPMFIAFAPHGAYLASTPHAFPEDAGQPQLLPAFSSGLVFANGFTTSPYAENPAKVAEITAKVTAEGYTEVVKALSEEPKTLGALLKVVKPLFEEADILQTYPLVYSILYSLKKEGKLEIITETVPGAFDGITAPQFKMKLK